MLAQGATEVPLYGVYEQTFTGSSNYTYTNAPILKVTFRGVSGEARGASLAVQGFWDGGSSFRVRFSPRLPGIWRYTTSSQDRGLNGFSGSVVVLGRLPAEHASHRGHIVANSDYPYTLMYSDGTPYFLMGDTQWSFSTDAISWPDEFQTYIDTRAAQGFNYVHGVVYQLKPDGNDTNEGGQSFHDHDVDRLNPGFWQAFDKRVEYMNQKGIVVGFVLAWANEGWTNFSTKAQVERYAQYVIDRYGAYNLIWVTEGEYEEATLPGGHNNLGNYFKDHDPYDHLRTAHTVNTTADDFGEQDWLTVIYQHLRQDLGKNITQDRIYRKPVINSEYGYEGRYPSDEVRYRSWEIVMSGGFYVYGNLTTFHANAEMTRSNLYSPGARYSTHLVNFFQKTDWWELEPEHGLVSGGGKYALANEDKEYVIYIKNGSRKIFGFLPRFWRKTGEAVSVDLSSSSPDATYSALWFNPKTGIEQHAGSVIGGASMRMVSPFFEDSVLLLSRHP